MKKQLIAVMLSMLVAMGSVGGVSAPVWAAETGETAVEAGVEAESFESAEPIEAVKAEEPEDLAEEPDERVSSGDNDIEEESEEAVLEDVEKPADKRDQIEDHERISTDSEEVHNEAIYGEEGESGENTEIEENQELLMEVNNNASHNTTFAKQMDFNGHTYRLYDEAKSWTEANVYCESLGGHLVTISSLEENDTVAEIAQSGSKHCYWIGAKLNENEECEWVTQEQMIYANWVNGEPDNYLNNQGYAFIFGKNYGSSGSVGMWGDMSDNGISWNNDSFYGTSNFGFICEWDDDISAPSFDYIEVDIDGNVTVHWKPESTENDISGYRIRHRIEGTAEWRATTVSNGSSSSVILKNLAADDYEIEIASIMTVNGNEISSPYSEPARCPVPTIEIINPANGSLFADSYALKPIIDFNHWAENTGEGSLHVYDNNHKEVLSQLLEKNSEEDTYTRLMASCSEGYTWDESKASNPKGVLKPNEFYHISIDEKAIQFLDGDDIEPYIIPVYFSGIKETDSTWKFKTVDLSYPGLINPKGLRIDEQYYHLLFDKEWERVIENDDGTKGHCFGLAYTVGAYEYGFPCLKDLTAGYSELSDVPICENSELLKYVQVAHLLQAYKAYARYEKNDRVYKLYNSVKSGTNVILDLEAGEGLHSVYSVGVIDDSDDSNIKIAVYDPNYPSIVASNGQDYRSFINIVTLSKGSTNSNWKLSYEASHIQYDLKGFHEIDSDYDPLIVSNMNLAARDVSKAAITGISNKIYTGNAITQKPKVTVGSSLLELGSDYTISYNNNINVGKASITITGVGKYTGIVTKTFMILPGKTTRGDLFNLANNVKVEWKEVPGARYYKVYRSGVTDPVIVTSGLVGWDKAPGLVDGKKYTYKIVASLTGKGDPSGDSSLSYSKEMYRLKTVAIKSVKNTAPGKVTVTYNKTTSGDSYVLQYCEREDMVGAKSKVVLGANNTSYTIGGLKKGKTYYISIRVRKKVNGCDYYTTFGVSKKITVTQ